MGEEIHVKSVYRYAGEAGIYLGLYLTAISFCLLLSNKFPLSSLLMIPLAIGLPFFVGWLISAIAKAEPFYRKFAALWLAGIYSFIFGTLICALFSALYLVFIEPDFFSTYLSNALKAMEQANVSYPFANGNILRQAVDQGMIPSPMSFVISMSWTSCFFGSMLSIPIALLISNSGKLNKSFDKF